MIDILNFIKEIAKYKWGSLENSGFSSSAKEYNMRCPICGDSKTNKRKKRFYYNIKKNIYFCFNCDEENRTGNLFKLLTLFPEIPNIDYTSLKNNTSTKHIIDFIKDKSENEDKIIKEKKYKIIYPDGARLDTILEEGYENFSIEDKKLLSDVLNLLKSRKIKKKMFKYFYFVFAGQKMSNYILTLFEYENEELPIWSGRRIDNKFPKYSHLPDFPFHTALTFENEISHLKGNIIYICESFFSSLILNQEGFNSVSVFGIENMRFNHPPLDKYREKFQLIWIPDNDDSFDHFYKLNKLHAGKMKIIILPDKDANDMIMRLGKEFKDYFLKLKPYSLIDGKIIKDYTKII